MSYSASSRSPAPFLWFNWIDGRLADRSRDRFMKYLECLFGTGEKQLRLAGSGYHFSEDCS